VSWRQPGRRARHDGRRGRHDEDPELEQTAWLAELEQAGDEEVDEEWARTLRGRRRQPGPGDPPLPPLAAAPDPPPPPRTDPPPPPRTAPPAPDFSMLGMETDSRPAAAEWDVDWGTQDPMVRPTSEPEPDWQSWGLDADGPLAWRAGQPAGGWSPDPPPVERPAGDRAVHPGADPELPWATGSAGMVPGSSTDLSGWPFEETAHGWEPSDRSWIWPAEELPPITGSWEPEPSGGLGQPAAADPGPAPWEEPSPSWDATPPPVPAAEPAWMEPEPPPPARPAAPAGPLPPQGAASPWAAEPVVPTRPAAGAASAAAAAWQEPPEPMGMADPPMAGEGRRVRHPEERRRSWPRVVAIISWIVLLMVVCWFYVFPWLERVLPENF
jgi:hypothetical protein